jgi:alkylhydroperoxidase family enzyme
MSEAVTRLRAAVVERALQGPGKASREARRAAFDNANVSAAAAALVDKVAHAAPQIGDADVAAVKAAGLSEDEIFELVVCAALGEATRQIEAALAVVDAVSKPGAA